jgi:hypothetical protein
MSLASKNPGKLLSSPPIQGHLGNVGQERERAARLQISYRDISGWLEAAAGEPDWPTAGKAIMLGGVLVGAYHVAVASIGVE